MDTESCLLAMRRLVLITIALSFVCKLASAGETATNEIWVTKGTVENPHLTPNSIMLRHEKIEGLMPAMTMPFAIKSRSLLDGVGYRDTVEVEFRKINNHFVIHKLKIVASQNSVTSTTPTEVSSFDITVPWDLDFFDSQGSTLSLRRFQNNIIVVSFIFTRCPTVCPLQTAKLQTALSYLTPEETQQVKFLSITVDPEYDRPERLEQYAKARSIDSSQWSFVTGSSETIGRALNSFNIVSLTQGSGDISHSLDVFLIESNNKSIRTYDGNNVSLAKDISRDISLLAGSFKQ